MPGGKNPPKSVIKTWPKPNYVNPETTGGETMIIAIVLGVIGTIVVFARLYARFIVIRRPGIDDYLIIVAWLFSFGIVTVIFLKEDYDGNKHVWDVRPGNGVMLNLTTYIGSALVVLGMGCIKSSMLLFYNRVLAGTSGRAFRYVIFSTLAFVVMYSIACFMVQIFNCSPVDSYWLRYSRNPPYTREYKCLSEEGGMVQYGVINVITDIWITLLPLFFIRRIQMPRRQRWALAALFGLGFFVCVAGLVRLRMIIKTYYETYDVTWQANTSWVWVITEYELGIFCASAPALKPLFSKYLTGTVFSFRSRKSSGYHQRMAESGGYSADSQGLKSPESSAELGQVPSRSGARSEDSGEDRLRLQDAEKAAPTAWR